MDNYQIKILNVFENDSVVFAKKELEFSINDFVFLKIQINLVDSEFSKEVIAKILNNETIEITSTICKYKTSDHNFQIIISAVDLNQEITLPITDAFYLAFSQLHELYLKEEEYINLRNDVL